MSLFDRVSHHPRVATVIFMIALGVVLFPLKKTVTPEAEIQILDVNGTPAAAGLLVEQRWADYSVSSQMSTEYASTDSGGRIRFPRRTARVPLLWRFISLVLIPAKAAFHMSNGTYATITVYNQTDPYLSAFEDNVGEPWPQVMQLERSATYLKPRVE